VLAGHDYQLIALLLTRPDATSVEIRGGLDAWQAGRSVLA
jgi:hypothetical protein